MEKPIELRTEELKKNLVETINKSNMPFFILDLVLKDLYSEIHITYENQLNTVKQSYEQSLEKEQEKESEK